MFCRSFFLLLALSFSLSGFKLKETLALAQEGEYYVTQQGKTLSLLLVREVSSPRVILEEITIPASQFQKENVSFREWLSKEAPGHTLWTISQLNLESGIFEECYSYDQRSWIDIRGAEQFLSTLLNLEFHPVKIEERKKIGFPPKYGVADMRHFWNPPIIFEGSKTSTDCEAYYTRWPNDHSELARRKIEIYLPSKDSLIPTAMPHWVEVDAKVTQMQFRVVDCGYNLRSPKHDLPQRPPEIQGFQADRENGLKISFTSPVYFNEFHLIAENQGNTFYPPHFLPHELRSTERGLEIQVPYETLTAELNPLEEYQLFLSPQGAPQLSIPIANTLVINNFR